MRKCLLFAVALLGLGCSSQDSEILAQVFHRTTEKVEKAAGGNINHFANRLQSTATPTIGLAERVQTRLKWDRYLDGLQITVEDKAPGIVLVRGEMPDIAKKQRVIDLTRSTMGVKDLVDELKLPKD